MLTKEGGNERKILLCALVFRCSALGAAARTGGKAKSELL